MSDFCHLHVHGQHSLLDGLTKPDEAVEAALADGQPAIALTDHGSLGGTLKFASAAEAAGLKFLPGIEMYLSLGSRFEHNAVEVPSDDDFDGTGGEGAGGKGRATKRKIYEHLTVLATSVAGWRNLMVLDSQTYDTFWQRPRADYRLLAEHAEGLVAGTGCLGGPVAGQLLVGNREQAEANLRTLLDVFGTGNVFVEVMDHGIRSEQRIVGDLTELAAKYTLPVIATNDAHFSRADQARHHDAWLCVSLSKGSRTVRVGDEKRWRFQGAGYHLRTAAEMHALFDDQPGTAGAVRNSLLVAERAEDRIVQRALADHHRVPVFPLAPGQTLEEVFHARVLAGLKERYGTPLPPEVKARARFEEDTIRQFGVMSYFLTIADVIAAERAAGGLVGAGRGSSGGSVAAFALGITRLDPLRHGLLFERFLNPTRKGLPDVDTDFQASRQSLVIHRAAETYGADRVARIGTYGQSWTKAAFKQMGRVLGRDAAANRLADAVPKVGDPKKTTIDILTDPANSEGAELRAVLAELGEQGAGLVEAARAIEGSAANETIHACGVVISDEPLAGTVPLRRIDPKEGGDPFPVTQWDAGDCEAANFVKFDFLAIKDLDVVADTVRLIAESTGEQVDVDVLDADLTDERSLAAKAMLAEGRTAGVFQLGSSGITELTRDIRPETCDDLAAILALYRPGPMGADQHHLYAARRRGGQAVDYGVFTPVPAEQHIIAGSLDRTLGCLVNQEQVMSLARDIADFGPGQMKDLQSAFSKKKQALMDSLKGVFFSGGMADHRRDGSPKVAFREETLASLWRAFEASGSYLFNACLPADTRLDTGRGRGPKAEQWTVGRLFHRLHGNPDADPQTCPFCEERPRAPKRPDGMCTRCRTWRFKFDDDRGFLLLAHDPSDNRIRAQRVADVHFSGLRPVLEITLADGKAVRATSNHRFLTPTGWRRVCDLRPGDALVVDGGYQRQVSGPENRTTVGPRRFEIPGGGHRPYQPGISNSGWVDGGFVKLKEWTAQTVAEARCACGRTAADGRIERAHLDGDRTNNDPSNLEWKCASCQKAYDYAHNGRRRRREKGRLEAARRIVSIVPAGEEPVYDVEMAPGTSHSFLANSIVSHNSHAYAYAVLTWQTAYLKANWPSQFGAALLANTTNQDKRDKVLADLVAEGVVVRPPSVVDGQAGTSVSAGEVLLGLAEIKGVGDCGAAIVAERGEHGPFASLYDLATRCHLNSGTVQALAEAGALDAFGTRLGISMVARAVRAPGLPVPDCEWGVLERTARQRARLGLSLGEHPLVALRATICASTALDPMKAHRAGLTGAITPDVRASVNVLQLHNLPRADRARVDTLGVVSRAAEVVGQRGRRLTMVVDSAKTAVECVMWPDQYATWRARHDAPQPGQVLGITGRVRMRIPVGTDESGEAETEPVISLVADRLWPVPLDDPATGLTPAPGTPQVLAAGPAPVPEPPVAEPARQACAGAPAVQPALVEAPAHGVFAVELRPYDGTELNTTLQGAWPAMRKADPDGCAAVQDWHRTAAPGAVLPRPVAGVDICWRINADAPRVCPDRSRLAATVKAARQRRHARRVTPHTVVA